jgi:hypothetical protein
MAEGKVADLVVEVVPDTGVWSIYGGSASLLHGITDSIRTADILQWFHVPHEKMAAFASGSGSFKRDPGLTFNRGTRPVASIAPRTSSSTERFGAAHRQD